MYKLYQIKISGVLPCACTVFLINANSEEWLFMTILFIVPFFYAAATNNRKRKLDQKTPGLYNNISVCVCISTRSAVCEYDHSSTD